MRKFVFATMAATVASSLLAQSNTVAGLDGRLTDVNSLTNWGRRGAAHPNGEAGMSMLNTMCNPGSVNIPWQAPMQPNHPMFGFIITRETSGRMVQISDWSYCKHAFTSVNVNGSCGTCVNPGTGSLMGLNCSDTYGAGNNGDRQYLGPPAEIDPWLGTWSPVGSYFDKGDPEVASPNNNDGARSTISTAGDNVKNRVTVKEQELLTAGTFYYGIQLIHRGEALANRGDNLASRGFVPTWSGTAWSYANSAPQQYGSILSRWSGATVNSATNGTDDGRIYVASKITPNGASFHYEYAVHNVDSNRGIASFRIPVDAGATVSGFGFRDIDADSLNNWVGTRVGNEIVFTAPANNPQNWNTVFNVWFDCTVAPSQGLFHCNAARIGSGGLTTSVIADVPSGIPTAFNTLVGTGCAGGAGPCQSTVYEQFGSAASFDLSNSNMGFALSGQNYVFGAAGGGAGYQATPTGTALTLTDDSTATVTLPFTLAFPGGTTTQLVVCSNGFISPVNNGTAFNPSAASFLTGAATWAGLWQDLNPASGGQVLSNVTATSARISFVNVRSFTGTGTVNVQYEFLSNNRVNIYWGTCAPTGNAPFTGWTPGNGATDPGSTNLTTAIPAGLTLCPSAPTVQPLRLDPSARPVLGTTISMNSSNIPAGTAFAALMFSAVIPNPAIDLTAIGMGGCFAYVDPATAQTFNSAFAPSTSWSQSLALPNNPAFVGASLGWQTVSFSPGTTAAGIITSNGVITLLAAQ
jgi:hypothetical protein